VLQAAADGYCTTVAKADGSRSAPATRDCATEQAANRAEFQACRKRLFESRPEPASEPEPTPVPPAYQLLMKRARKLAKSAGITAAQAFEKLYIDPANVELATAAKRPAAAGHAGRGPLPYRRERGRSRRRRR
jgi:hypothetical protein